MFTRFAKFWYPFLGAGMLYWIFSSYTTGDFGTKPEEALAPKAGEKASSYRPRRTGGGGFFIFAGK